MQIMKACFFYAFPSGCISQDASSLVLSALPKTNFQLQFSHVDQWTSLLTHLPAPSHVSPVHY